MDIEEWGRHQHELHSRVAPVRAVEYGVPIFRLASSGISQSVLSSGQANAQVPFPGRGEILASHLQLPTNGSLPLDRWLAPVCTGITAVVTGWLLFLKHREHRQKSPARPA
jgi:apolipoprotein N-acyltransferase